MNGTLSDTLTRLAQSLESLQPAGAQPVWAEIIGPLDYPERVRWHPDLASMIGFVAPPECSAIASIGYGWARPAPEATSWARPAPEATSTARSLEDPETSPAPRVGLLQPGERRRTRVVCLLTRSGDMVGYLREGSTVLVNEPPTSGRVPDFMRRCFALATPPPEEPTDGLLARMWLSNVVGLAEREGEPLSWAAVLRLHPAMQVADEAGIAVPASQAVAAIRVGADAWGWTYLMQEAVSGGWLADLLPPGAGEWMDEGILSRWLLQSITTLDVLLDRVTPLITPGAAKRLRTTLRQLGL